MSVITNSTVNSSNKIVIEKCDTSPILSDKKSRTVKKLKLNNLKMVSPELSTKSKMKCVRKLNERNQNEVNSKSCNFQNCLKDIVNNTNIHEICVDRKTSPVDKDVNLSTKRSFCNERVLPESPSLTSSKSKHDNLNKKSVRKKLFSNLGRKKEFNRNRCYIPETKIKSKSDESVNVEKLVLLNHEDNAKRFEKNIDNSNSASNSNAIVNWSPVLPKKCKSTKHSVNNKRQSCCLEYSNKGDVLGTYNNLVTSNKRIDQYPVSLQTKNSPLIVCSTSDHVDIQQSTISKSNTKSSNKLLIDCNANKDVDLNVFKQFVGQSLSPFKKLADHMLKTPTKNQQFLDSDSEDAISEFSSPTDDDKLNTQCKRFTQVKKTANFNKVWSIEKDYFEKAFEQPNIEVHIDPVSSPVNKLEIFKKKITLESLDKHQAELSNVFDDSNENNFEISDTSSEPSPVNNSNVPKLTSNKKCTILTGSRNRKRKSDEVFPVLEMTQSPYVITSTNSVQKSCVLKSNKIKGKPSQVYDSEDLSIGRSASSQNRINLKDVCSSFNNLINNKKVKKRLSSDTVTHMKISDVDDHSKQNSDSKSSPILQKNYELCFKETELNNGRCLSPTLSHQNTNKYSTDVYNITPNNSQNSQFVIESVSSPSQSTSNKSIYEIQFSDVTSIDTEIKTPPSKTKQNTVTPTNFDSTTKKRRRKYPDGSLVSRFCTLRNRFFSDARLLQHMLSSKEKNTSTSSLPIFVVENVWQEFSRTLLKCSLQNTDFGVRRCDNQLVINNLVIKNELCVITDGINCAQTSNINIGTLLRIHPPWKVWDIPDDHMTVVLGTPYLEVVTDTLMSSLQFINTEKSRTVSSEINCNCYQDLQPSLECNFQLTDHHFTEILCPPPSTYSSLSKTVPKKIPNFYFDDTHLSGTIGYGHAFHLLNPNINFSLSVVKIVKQRLESFKCGSGFLVVKDAVDELGIVVFLTDSDFDKWNIVCDNSSEISQLYRFNGLKFSYRTPIKMCEMIQEIECLCLPEQKYIYYLSPASDWWSIEKISCDN